MAVSAVVESVFNAILEQLAEEIGALLGSPIELSEHRVQLLTKEELFAISRSRSVLSTMVISGDQSGESYIISDLKDSIILGGTLIMLPPDQIEENCKQRSFDGEAADAYGEVANIIAGVYTSVFLDMYPENIHFKRTSVENFVPTQLDPAADTPFPPGEYVHSTCAMALEGHKLHNLEVIVPAQLLGQGTQPEPEPEPEPQPEPVPEPAAEEEPAAAPAAAEEAPAPEPEPPQPVVTDYVDLPTVDRTLRSSITQCVEEIGGMLGLELEIEGISLRYTTKQEYFSRPGKKAIATQLTISGDNPGTGYFITELKDSIFFGGTMIMLPATEIEKCVSSGELSEDIEDAFGEVANIVSGGFGQNFEELYPRDFKVKKGEFAIFTPTRVLVDSPEPFPAGDYYQVTGSLSCESHDLGDISFLCPIEVLHIAPPLADTGWGAPAAAEEAAPAPQPAKSDTASEPEKVKEETAPQEPKEEIVVIVGDDQTENAFFANSLEETDHTSVQLSPNESFSSLRQYSILGAFLLMSTVDEQAFGHMIKLRSEIPSGKPLIVAGPQWTRSDVIKAVRYGATDIIVTPATEDEIREKVTTNLKTTCH